MFIDAHHSVQSDEQLRDRPIYTFQARRGESPVSASLLPGM